MKTVRHTLVIDGNYFLFKTLYVIPHMTKSKEILSTKKDMETFMRKLATDFAYETRKFEGLIDRIIFTLDSRSWRKDFHPQADYKGNRKADSKINWENFSKITSEFESLLQKKGVLLHKVQGAEGDDLMYAWNTHCTAKGKSVILFTGDKDMIQLVNRNDSTKAHTILYSPVQKKLYTYQGFTEWMAETPQSENVDIFTNNVSLESISKNLFAELLKTKKMSIIEVNPDDIAFKKVLTGDSGDNVAPIYYYTKTLKNGQQRTYGVSDKKAQAILDEFREKHGNVNPMYFFTNDYVVDVAQISSRVLKAKHMTIDQLIKNIKLNANLVLLNSKTIPESILEEMLRTVELLNKQNNLEVNNLTTMNKILEGSGYEKGNISMTSAMLSDSDDDDDETDDFSFITDKKGKGKLF
jgi:5'-3' exonuclease